MIKTLLQSFNLVKKPVKKEQLIKTFEQIHLIAQEDVLPALTELKNYEKSSKITKSEIFGLTKELIKINGGKSKNIISDLESLFIEIGKNVNGIEQLLNKHTSFVLTNKVMGVKDAAIVKLVDDIGSLTLFSMDYITCLLSNVNDTAFPKIKFKKLKEGIPAFINLVVGYNGKIKNTIDNITKLDDTSIDSNTSEAMLGVKLNSSGITSLVPDGFINNPFYHIRMWFVDREINKLEALRDKKKLIELRIMELKIEEKSGSDGDLSKQIEYYEDKLAAIEYKIQKLEEE